MEFLRNLIGRRGDAKPFDPCSVTSGVALEFDLIECHGRDVRRFWGEQYSEPGVTPIVLGPTDGAKHWFDRSAGSRTVAEVLNAAGTVDLDGWLRERDAEARQFAEEDALPWPPRGEFDGTPDTFDPVDTLSRRVLTRRYAKSVLIGLFPTDDATEVPAHLDCGG